MGYNFTKGHYQAFIRTTYKDWTGASQTVDGPPAEFDCNMKTVLRFKTNPNIIVDEDELIAVDADKVSEGTYKGLEYEIYDNGLAIIHGTQTEAVDTSDPPAWNSEDVLYIYAQATFCSGNVFRTNYGKELQLGNCDFASGTTSATTLFFGNNWDYINFEKLDWTNLTSFVSVLNTVTKAQDGFENYKNRVLNDTSITSLGSAFNSFRITEQEISFEFNIPSRITSASAFLSGFGGPNVSVFISVDSYLTGMLNYIGNCNLVDISVTNAINPSSITDLLYYSDAINFHADIELSTGSGTRYMPRISQNGELEYVTFSNRLDTSTITNFNMAFKSNPKLIDISKRQGDSHYGYQYSYPFDFTAAKSFANMFDGDTYLAGFGRRTQSSLSIDTNTKYMTYSNMFKNCAGFEWELNIHDRTGYILSMESAFEGSGITELNFVQDGTAGRLLQIMGDNFRCMCRNATKLEYLTMQFTGTFGVGNVRYDSMCDGCTSLKEATIDGVYIYDSSTGNQYSSIDVATSMFKNCTSLEELSIYECDVGNDSSGDVTDMLTGCTALISITLSTNTVIPSSKPITLPKTMYLNGSAVNSITKGRGSQAVYTATA